MRYSVLSSQSKNRKKHYVLTFIERRMRDAVQWMLFYHRPALYFPKGIKLKGFDFVRYGGADVGYDIRMSFLRPDSNVREHVLLVLGSGPGKSAPFLPGIVYLGISPDVKMSRKNFRRKVKKAIDTFFEKGPSFFN